MNMASLPIAFATAARRAAYSDAGGADGCARDAIVRSARRTATAAENLKQGLRQAL
jgi:hypothetical protein